MLTIEDALNAIEAVVKGREGHTYGGGYYIDGTSRCIVGEALHSLGVTDSALAAMGGTMIDTLAETNALPIPMSLGAVVVFRAAQRTQDGLAGDDVTWGAAFDSAIKTASRYMDLMPDSVVRDAATSLTPAMETV